MGRIDEIVAGARAERVRPWIAIKEKLSECVLSVMARDGGATLQGGAALHFVYDSPRLSADVDYVGPAAGDVLEAQGDALARAASDWSGCEARWSMRRAGLLVRGKLTLRIDAARRLALPVEAYEVPARVVRAHAVVGPVEDPVEIAADKIVASADRLARRGTLKTTDLYDLWYLRARLGTAAPEPSLITAKIADYGQARRGADLAAAVRAVTPEELRAVLESVLPIGELHALDERAVLETAADLLGPYHDLV